MQENHLINKYDIGHKKVDYEITEKGLKCLLVLRELKRTL